MSRYSRTAADTTLDRPPHISAHYFYNSSLYIDDPLSPVPISHPSSTARLVPRPFSDHDSIALEKAWIRWNVLNYREHEESTAHPGTKSINERRPPLRSDHLQDVSSHASVQGAADQRDEKSSVSDAFYDGSGMPRRQIARFQDTEDGQDKCRHGSILEQRDEREANEHLEAGGDAHGLSGRPFARTETNSSELGESSRPEYTDDHRSEEETCASESTVPVGVARIHQVWMPKLVMGPIYWNTVHERYPVTRGTWFYKDTLLPVEVDIANLLERGYLELRPWTETWKDELNSATEVGALGEERIAHLLWPNSAARETKAGRGPKLTQQFSIGEDGNTLEQRRRDVLATTCNFIDKSVGGPYIDNKAADAVSIGNDGQGQLYLQSSVIYANERDATILRPSLTPSAYYGRRPYANYIRKGFKIGVPVVRGFDRQAFDQVHQKNGKVPRDPPKSPKDERVSETQTSQVTDLVLVIHGIGQKLSERVESFHFTHAMNAFRREINVELDEPKVRTHLRKNMGKIMVLPVNWRSTLSFDEGGYSEEPATGSQNGFSLRDITPDSIPAVRHIISDVMLDIPYYLSHHQPKIISAVIKEANRIFRLWCRNNPGFQEQGRVHLIAHSLGSVMAMDILSKQPTTVDMSATERDSETTNFVFDTRNLFLCGSPAGFFLLLKKATLLPRKDRKHHWSPDSEDCVPTISNSQNTYGCLAVDNIYNIVNPYDPIAYRLNATVDAAYAASLKSAYVPSSSTSWFSFGNAFRARPPSTSELQNTPTPASQQFPSNVELEVHNFTREEIAEKRAYLLNDNGQIDYLLQYGGGPLEIKYLTMLGAHSSYWTSRDFIRFIVIETSRTPGKVGTLEEMRATKKKNPTLD